MFQLTLIFPSSCNKHLHWKKQHFFWEALNFLKWSNTFKRARNCQCFLFLTQSSIFRFLHVSFHLLISSNSLQRNVWNIQTDLIAALVDLDVCSYDQQLYKVENSLFINFFRVSRFPIFSAISNAIYFSAEKYITISYITLLFRINWSIAYPNFSSFEATFFEHSGRYL